MFFYIGSVSETEWLIQKYKLRLFENEVSTEINEQKDEKTNEAATCDS
jgi:hypothetical protein